MSSFSLFSTINQTVISTGIEFTSLTKSPFPPDSDPSNLSQIQDVFQGYAVFQAINVAPAHPIDLELALGNEHHWRASTKTLSASDVSNIQARLLLPRENFPTTMDQYLVEQCTNVKGQRFKVEDTDTGDSYTLTLKKWSSGSYIFTTNWIKDFVKRRNLKVNDTIGMLWDSTNSKFYFSVRNRGFNNIANE